MKPQTGFSLLELLIALAIFSLLSALSYQALNQLIVTEQETRLRTEAISELQRAMLFWERDVEQIVARPINSQFGEPLPAVLQGSDMLIEFSTVGYRDWSEKQNHHTQRVRYSLENKQLIRESWAAPDYTQFTKSQRIVLLHDVLSAEVELEPKQDKTIDKNIGILAIPNALSLTIEHQQFGIIKRILVVHLP